MRHRLPSSLRARLVLVSAGLSTLALFMILTGLYLALASQLKAGVEKTLVARAADLATAVAQGDLDAVRADPFAQLVSRSGAVLVRSASAPSTSLLSGKNAAPAQQGPVMWERDVPGLGSPAVLRSTPVGSSGKLLLAGSSLEEVEAARTRTLLVLLMSLPILVIALAVGVHAVVEAAMRPVRLLTREAAAISATDVRRRLTVPAGDDEIAELARTLDEMLQRLADSVEREREFVDNASHELRTPLAVLLGELELADSGRDLAEVRQSVGIAREQGHRLNRLAQDLLTLARESHTSADRSLPKIDLVTAARTTVAGAITDGGTEIRVEGKAVHVPVDPVQFERVLLNLVNNARAAGATHVLVLVRQDTDDVLVEVHDDGHGFPPALLESVFDRFTRGDTARTADAQHHSGLGLAIVRSIVTNHHGSAVADNDSMLGGARVVIRLQQG